MDWKHADYLFLCFHRYELFNFRRVFSDTWKGELMLRTIYTLLLAAIWVPSLSAVVFYWQPKGDEPGFTIDVPGAWKQASRARDGVANAQFERLEKSGRIAIEVRAYSSEASDIEQLVLQLRTRLAVKFDRVYLLGRKGLHYRKDVEKQIWSAMLGKKKYTLTTAFVVQDGKVLQIICIAPANRAKEYALVFDNAFLSLNFSDGAPESGSGSAAKHEEVSSVPESTPTTTTPPAAAVPAVPAIPTVPSTGSKVPKITF